MSPIDNLRHPSPRLGTAAYDQALAAILRDIHERFAAYDSAKADFDRRLKTLESKLGLGSR